MKIGCTRCPHAGHIELKECVDAYTEVAEHCGAYNHNELDEKIDQEPVLSKSKEHLSIDDRDYGIVRDYI